MKNRTITTIGIIAAIMMIFSGAGLAFARGGGNKGSCNEKVPATTLAQACHKPKTPTSTSTNNKTNISARAMEIPSFSQGTATGRVIRFNQKPGRNSEIPAITR